MKILFLAPIGGPLTGHSLASRVLLEALEQHCLVEVVDLSPSAVRQGVTLSKLLHVVQLLREIRRKRRSCDSVYFTVSESYAGNLKDLAIYLMCYRLLGRMVVHLHGGAGMRRIMNGRRRFLRAPNRFFLRRVRAVIVLGQRHLDIFAGAVEPSRVHMVPNFAEDYMFANPGRVEEKFASTSPLRILFLSNFLFGKGHAEIVAAVRSLSEVEREALRVDFAGAFETKRQEQEFLAGIQDLPQLDYHGPVYGERKRKLFEAAHVFCLPTYYPYEGQPISILEAYAAGCVVVATDHSGIFDVFRDGVNGYAVEKRSAVALQTAFRRLLAEREQLEAIGQRNLSLAKERYRVEEYVRKVLDIIFSGPDWKRQEAP